MLEHFKSSLSQTFCFFLWLNRKEKEKHKKEIRTASEISTRDTQTGRYYRLQQCSQLYLYDHQQVQKLSLSQFVLSKNMDNINSDLTGC